MIAFTLINAMKATFHASSSEEYETHYHHKAHEKSNPAPQIITKHYHYYAPKAILPFWSNPWIKPRHAEKSKPNVDKFKDFHEIFKKPKMLIDKFPKKNLKFDECEC